MHATLASRDVDCCLIPESPFYLEGKGGLFEHVEKTLKENGHMVIVMAEGAGQELLAESLQAKNELDPSGNKLLQDVGFWISQKIKVRMTFMISYLDIFWLAVSGFGFKFQSLVFLYSNHVSMNNEYYSSGLSGDCCLSYKRSTVFLLILMK